MSAPKPTEPGILAFIAEVDSHYPPKSVEAPIEKQRERYDALCRGFDAPLPAGMMVTDETAPHPDGTVPLRRYRPAADGREARSRSFQRGGFVVGGLPSHTPIPPQLPQAALRGSGATPP